MDPGSVDRIRNARFSHAVRGYDRHEVDQFLAELADWLEDSDDDAVAASVRAELERIGEQTAGILTDAHDAAQAIRSDAEREVRQTLIDANLKSEALRSTAEEYAEETREEADAYARKARADADAYARKTRGDTDSYVANARKEVDGALEKARAAGEREAKQIAEEANRRRRDIEAVISDLEERRDAVLSELERLASGLAGTATQHRSSPRDASGQSDGDGEQATKPRPARPAQKSK
jgi:DivIVA domain-containing protein